MFEAHDPASVYRSPGYTQAFDAMSSARQEEARLKGETDSLVPDTPDTGIGKEEGLWLMLAGAAAGLLEPGIDVMPYLGNYLGTRNQRRGEKSQKDYNAKRSDAMKRLAGASGKSDAAKIEFERQAALAEEEALTKRAIIEGSLPAIRDASNLEFEVKKIQELHRIEREFAKEDVEGRQKAMESAGIPANLAKVLSDPDVVSAAEAYTRMVTAATNAETQRRYADRALAGSQAKDPNALPPATRFNQEMEMAEGPSMSGSVGGNSGFAPLGVDAGGMGNERQSVVDKLKRLEEAKVRAVQDATALDASVTELETAYSKAQSLRKSLASQGASQPGAPPKPGDPPTARQKLYAQYLSARDEEVRLYERLQGTEAAARRYYPNELRQSAVNPLYDFVGLLRERGKGLKNESFVSGAANDRAEAKRRLASLDPELQRWTGELRKIDAANLAVTEQKRAQVRGKYGLGVTEGAGPSMPRGGPGRSKHPGSAKYMGQVQAAASATGIDPALLAGLITVESGWDPSAVSSAGAVGLTQLMPGTAPEVGVASADRSDPVKSIYGGARYLATMMRRYEGHKDQVRMALAAYNYGPGNISPGKPWAQQPKGARDYAEKVLAEMSKFRLQTSQRQEVVSAGEPAGTLGEVVALPSYGGLGWLFGDEFGDEGVAPYEDPPEE